MVENRKRQIIKSQSLEGAEENDVFEHEYDDDDGHYVEYQSGENMLAKRVYLPWPVIMMGFVTIVFASVMTTYVAMNWPTSGLDFPVNPELERFEAAANPGNLPNKTFRPDSTLAVTAPVSDLGTIAGGASRFAAVQQNQVPDGLGRTFALKKITPTKVPVADLAPPSHLTEAATANINAQRAETTKAGKLVKANGVKPPVIDLSKTLRIDIAPTTRSAAGSLRPADNLNLTAALGVDAPTTLLTLITRNPGDVIKGAQTTPQKLMRQRYAKAVTTPVMEEGGNPLLRPVTGQGLPIKTAKLEGVTGVSAPVADLEFADTRIANPGGPGVNLETKQYTLRETRTLTDPVINMTLPERKINSATQGIINKGLATKEVTLTEAFGLDNPAALLNLPVRRVSANDNKLDIPGQKLMQRRYAKAVTNPEQMDFILPPTISAPPTSETSLENLDPWQRYAAAVPDNIEGMGKIVIIIDDMGNNSGMAKALGELEGPLNFAFLPYAPNLQRQTKTLRDQGHELLVHMPMEPIGNESPGPNALLTSLSDQELLEAIEWNLTQFEGFVGVNNHMGSRFTKDSDGMKLVMEELQKRGLLFLDSRTAPNSEGAKWAKRLRMPWAGRDIFLDNEVNEAAILGQLRKVEDMAQDRGIVIAIGHPHSATLKALKAWIPTLEGKGLVLVPLSSIVEFEGQLKLANANTE